MVYAGFTTEEKRRVYLYTLLLPNERPVAVMNALKSSMAKDLPQSNTLTTVHLNGCNHPCFVAFDKPNNDVHCLLEGCL